MRLTKVLKIYSKEKGITAREKVADIRYNTVEGLIEARVPYRMGMVTGNCYKLEYSVENVDIIKIDSLNPEECEI